MARLTWNEIETRAVAFSNRWKNAEGKERQEGQTFEKDLMNVFGIEYVDGYHEYPVKSDTGRDLYVDYFLPGKIVLEMKSKGESLITAYNQAKDYVNRLENIHKPELIVVSDFVDMEVTNLRTGQRFNKFKISRLKDHVRKFGVIAGYTSEVDFETDIEVNTKAAYKMTDLFKELEKHGYNNQQLQLYLVRILFCLFAEDTGIFEKRSFENYIKDSREDGSDLAYKINALFAILNQPTEERMDNLPDELKGFRYINGDLFKEFLPPAAFDRKMRKQLIDCCDFDWSFISPAVFGAMFQGVMNEENRRQLGAHYTSEENIMKVLKPLFLDDLWEEFERKKHIIKDLEKFHEKISKLTFLDPACGCGNFLILAYRELRLLEFEVLQILHSNDQIMLIDSDFSDIQIHSFYGIEYEEFSARIAKLSMLLMKHQMDQLVSNYFGYNLIDFPIKESANIVTANALTTDWNDVIQANDLDYIIGNPPFVGTVFQTSEQKEELKTIFHNRTMGQIDYVTAWFVKSALIMKENPNIAAALVATNSITQGDQVANLWDFMFNLDTEIDFVYTTFNWSNEAKGKAAVHCVIIGFSNVISNTNKKKRIYDSDMKSFVVKNISPYLFEGPNITVKSVSRPLSKMEEMIRGNQPTDDGNFILTDEEREEIINEYPPAEEWIKKYIGAREFIDRTYRWVLWLRDISPQELRKSQKVTQRIEAVKNFRLESVAKGTNKSAQTPSLFVQIVQPRSGEYIVVPRVSSERRDYVPIGYVDHNIIASDAVFTLQKATLLHFGILTSSTHMNWLRTVGGRLKSDYRYSNTLVYNTFPWPEINDDVKMKIEKTAQAILDARELYPDATYADLYDPLFMPVELRKAHIDNDKAVWEAYGKKWEFGDEQACTAYLMKLYKEMVNR